MPIIRSSRLYMCYYLIRCLMPWMLVVSGQMQCSRVCVRDEGNCAHSFPDLLLYLQAADGMPIIVVTGTKPLSFWWIFLFPVERFCGLCSVLSSLVCCLCPAVSSLEVALQWDLRQHVHTFNPLKPNDAYRRRTVPLTSKVAIYIFIQQV